MSQQSNLLAPLKEDMLSALLEGTVDREVVRQQYPELTPRQFGLAWSAVKKKLEDEQGIFLKSVGRGQYVVRNKEGVIDRAMNWTRQRIIKVGDDNLRTLRAAQVSVREDADAYSRLNNEEILQTRTIEQMKRGLRRGGRKRPEGL